MTAHHLPNPQGQTHSANYFKVNSFYCLRKEFALAVFFCNRTPPAPKQKTPSYRQTIFRADSFLKKQIQFQPRQLRIYFTASLVGQLLQQRMTWADVHNIKFALCGLTFRFENLYLRFMFVMADKLVFINPAQRKFEER